MPTNTLTDAACRKAVATDKPLKLFDGGGLYLYVSPTGAKVWRLAFRLDGKPQQISFGPYPALYLADARKKRDAYKAELLVGIDPRKPKKRDSVTFEQASNEYWDGRNDLSATYRAKSEAAVRRHLLPMIGGMAMEQIDRDALMSALLPVDAAGKYEQVRNLRAWAGQIFDRAIERGYCKLNPAALIRPEKAFGKSQTRHLAALELHQVHPFMQRLALEGNTQSAVMCRLMALTWVRTGVLRRMLWSELDGDIWRIPGAKMKMRKDLLVPLPKQAKEILAMMRQRRTVSEFVFPNPGRPDRPASENAVLSLLYRMGYKGEMTGHGWRSVGSTWANENGFDADAIERQLAHVPKDEVRATYNRAQYIAKRRELLQAWADWLFAEDVDSCGLQG